MQSEKQELIDAPYKGSEPYIFVSYAHKNIDEISEILINLQKHGYRIWYDEGIDPGIEWAENIANRLSECECFLAFMTREYMESTNCQDELSYARDINKQRLIVYLDDVDLSAGMSMRMNRIQAIFKYTYRTSADFYDKLFSSDALKNCKAIKKKAIIRSMISQHQGKPIEVGEKPILIGRDAASCTLIYRGNTAGVSSRHCTVMYDAEKEEIIITDLHSTYGTFLREGKKLDAYVPYHLKSGDFFFVGDMSNVITIE